jgi:predicted sugar kinase
MGGGGIGLALDVRIGLEIAPTDEWSAKLPDHESILHLGRCLTSAIGASEAFSIARVSGPEVPFDPTPEVYSAVAAGINASLGRPMGQRELRRFIGNNAMHEEEGTLTPMVDNGVRIAGALSGGLLLMTSGLEVACRAPLPEDGSVILVPPRSAPQALDMERMVQIEVKDREKKAHEVLMRLLPAAIRSDLPRMGDSIYRLQLLGSKVAEIRRFGGGNEIYRLLSALRIKGCEVVGVHADTGIVAAFVRNDLVSVCASMLGEIGMNFTICRPDSRGATVQMLP